MSLVTNIIFILQLVQKGNDISKVTMLMKDFTFLSSYCSVVS